MRQEIVRIKDSASADYRTGAPPYRLDEDHKRHHAAEPPFRRAQGEEESRGAVKPKHPIHGLQSCSRGAGKLNLDSGARCPQRVDLRADGSKPDEDIAFHLAVVSISEVKRTSTAWPRLGNQAGTEEQRVKRQQPAGRPQ